MERLTSFLPQDFHVFSLNGILLAASALIAFVTISAIWSAIYNLYFHPLKHIPGPLFARASPIPFALLLRNGKRMPWLNAAHDRYGEVVRVTPDELSFISGETAWQDIYGFRTGTHKTPPYLKDTRYNVPPPNGVRHLLFTDEPTHSRIRRNLSHAFSNKALKDQEPLVQGLVDLLITRLSEQVQDGQCSIDMMRWYNFTTFDVITDLVYGEPLYCLRDSANHPWISLLLGATRAAATMSSGRRVPVLGYLDAVKNVFSAKSSFRDQSRQFNRLVSDKVSKRIADGTTRPDFMSHILKNQDSGAKGLSKAEMDSNAVLLMIAGSETTATLLTGFTYLLTRNPRVYKKLVDEIRGSFKDQSEITFEAVNKLEYLIASLQEGLRAYPPVPTGFARVVPQGGDTISGHYVPEGTAVYMSQYTANHSTRNFKDPEAFVPERWMGDATYKDDNRAVVNPFSFGPRNCLGKNLAYAEMRVIVAKILFNFDVELQEESRHWVDESKVYVLWEKPSLMMKLKPVQG